jgi:FkbM family methyltransferase
VHPRVWKGELLRWYLKRAKHPLKDYLVGHYWSWFSNTRVWVKYDGDSAISVSLGDYIQERIFFDDYYERPLILWLKEHLRPSDVFWDVGANIGAVTLVAARLCGRVVAFEPNPHTAALLRRNLETNRIGNVTVVEAALCDRSGIAALHEGPRNNSGMSSIVARGARENGTPVAVERADDVVAQDPSRHPTVVKLDVEGGEHLVLRGARQLLSSTRVRAIVFENARDARGQAADSSVIDCLRAAGFRIHELGPSVPEAPDDLSNFIAARTSDTATR